MLGFMRMRTYRNYIVRQIIFLMLVLSLLFVIVFVVGNLMRVSSMLSSNRISVNFFFKLIFYFIPFVIGYTLPVSIVAAIVLLFGRLSADKEIIALGSSGVGLAYLTAPLLALALVMSTLTFLINDKLVPNYKYQIRKLIAEVGNKTPFMCLQENTFIDLFPGYIIYIHRVNGNRLKFIRIYQLRGELPPRVLVADRGVVLVNATKNRLRMELEDVVADEVDPRNPEKFYKFYSKRYAISFNIPKNVVHIERKLKEYSLRGLIAKLRKFQEMRLDISPIKMEIHRRISFSFAPLVLLLLGIPLSIRASRRDTSSGLILVGGIIFVYYMFMLMGDAMVIRKVIPVWLGMWMADVLCLVMGIFLISREW